MSTWVGSSFVCSNNSLDIIVKVFLRYSSHLNQYIRSKDYSVGGEQALFKQLRALKVRSRKEESLHPDSRHHFLPRHPVYAHPEDSGLSSLCNLKSVTFTRVSPPALSNLLGLFFGEF